MIDYDIKFQLAQENLYSAYIEFFMPFLFEIFKTELNDPSLKKTFEEYKELKNEMSPG